MTVTRASAVGLHLTCPQAAQTAQTYPADTEYAAVGRAVHSLLAYWIEHKDAVPRTALSWRTSAIRAAAAQGLEDHDDVEQTARWAWSAWLRVRQYFEAPGATPPQTELALRATFGQLLLTGHIDVLTIAGPRAFVLDFKTGWGDENHRPQLLAYCALVFAEYPAVEEIWAGTLLVRHRETDAQLYDREEVAAWTDGLRQRLAEDTYQPGRHCTRCHRRLSCPALAEYVRTIAGEAIRPTLGPELRDAYERAKTLESYAKTLRDGIRAIVAQNGPVDVGHGEQLEITEQRQTIVLPDALPIIEDIVGPDHARECIKIGKGKLEDLLKRAAGRGQGAAFIRDTMDRLAAENVLAYQFVDKLELRPRRNEP